MISITNLIIYSLCEHLFKILILEDLFLVNIFYLVVRRYRENINWIIYETIV